MWEVLIVPKSAGLFLINLDDVFVLHPQLTGTHNTDTVRTTRFTTFLYSNIILKTMTEHVLTVSPPRCVEHVTVVTIFKTTPKKYWCWKLFSESWRRTDTWGHKTIELNEKINLTTARTNCSWWTAENNTLNITLLVWMYRCCRRRVLTSSQTLRINMSNFSKMSTFGKNSTYVYNNNNIQLEMSFIWFPLW